MGVDDAGAVRANLQNALDVAEALGLRGGDVDLLDELGFLLAGRLDLELLGLLAQFGRPSWAASSSRESVGSVGAALRSLLRCLRSR